MKESDAVVRIRPRALIIIVALIGALYLAQALYYASVLVPVHDGIQYLLVGAKAVRGEIGLYDDRLVGNRLPLPFYALGLSQVLAGGPSLRAARWLNIGFGLLTLLLTSILARRLAGDVAAILAALFLATQGVVVAYYSYEGYPSFAALCLVAALSVFVAAESPGRLLLGTGLMGLLFFVRSNLWPVIPFVLAYSLWRGRTLLVRVALVGAVALPPLIFLAWDSTHLKILAYVPVVRRFVARLGYVSAFTLDDRQTLPVATQIWEIARVLRRYEFWVLAAALLIAIRSWQALRGRPAGHLPEWAAGYVRMLTALLVFSIASLFVMYSWNFRWVGLYFLPYTPLAALLLGIGYAGLLARARPRSWPRYALMFALVGLLLPPLYFVRNPLLPVGEVLAKDPLGSAHVAAGRLRALVPPDAKVFFYGLNEVYYLAGLPATYLQQVYSPNQFVRVPAEDWVIHRSGFVTARDMRDWLTRDADYAVIDLSFVEVTRPEFVAEEHEMLQLLDRHFDRVGTVSDYPSRVYAVYRRKAG
jgi:4-amino-4-deoxy-L-arabinose transferase-like glycosyltransferase